MVIHPADKVLLEWAGRLGTVGAAGASVEHPRVLLWRSPSDDQRYTLIEYLALERQPRGDGPKDAVLPVR